MAEAEWAPEQWWARYFYFSTRHPSSVSDGTSKMISSPRSHRMHSRYRCTNACVFVCAREWRVTCFIVSFFDFYYFPYLNPIATPKCHWHGDIVTGVYLLFWNLIPCNSRRSRHTLIRACVIIQARCENSATSAVDRRECQCQWELRIIHTVAHCSCVWYAATKIKKRE